MSLTLGEKLRQAREERGISTSEVAEQTRISPQYIESIENDDYRGLPGGIFNKGFVKSFAKYVGVDEQEALMDYSQLISANSAQPAEEPRTYRPEVMTDDRSYASNAPTIIVAVLILALMTAGVLFLVNYLRKPSEPVAANTAIKNTNVNTEVPANTQAAIPGGAPDMSTLKVEVKAVNKLSVIATVDAEAPKKNDLQPGASVVFEPKEKITLNYLRWNAANLEVSINGKNIELPKEPMDNPKAQRIEFTISKDNLAQIWSTASITGVPAAPADANTKTAAAVTTPAVQRPTPLAPKPANIAAANTAAKPANTKPVAAPTPNPPTMMTSRPKPTP